MKISLKEFKNKLKEAGRATRERLFIKANENERLLFLFNEFIKTGVIINKTLKNENTKKEINKTSVPRTHKEELGK